MCIINALYFLKIKFINIKAIKFLPEKYNYRYDCYIANHAIAIVD